MKSKKKVPGSYILAGFFLAGSLAGCNGDDGITSIDGLSTITLQVNGLQPIVGGLNYQAWLVVGTSDNFWGYPLVLFNIDQEGRMVDAATDTVLSGPHQVEVDSDAVLGVAVSLEITDTLVDYSSFTFILGGEMIQGTATLTAEDWVALNRDLSGVSGRFVLSTPTDEEADNELSGVWFIDPTADPVAAGLVLPEAPRGWTYEGWVEVDGEPFSTGKFVSPNFPDSSAAYSGTIDAHAFPGEDFLFNAPQGATFPLDLAGATVFITMEPAEIWDVFPRAPFFLKILEGQVPGDPVPMTPYAMTSRTSQLPSGTATVQGS